jgi:hypothetical protein
MKKSKPTKTRDAIQVGSEFFPKFDPTEIINNIEVLEIKKEMIKKGAIKEY